MPATDSSLMDYVVTYGGPSIFMTAVFVFVLPLVYFKFARPRYARWPARLAVLLGVWCLAFGVAYGDVFLIARDAKRLCETEAGMKIYRTVEAEGFAGVSSLGAWSERGFDFVEIVLPDGSATQQRLVNGSFVSKKVETAESRYEYTISFESETPRIERQVEVVQERANSGTIGELVVFRPSLGWIDTQLAAFLGASDSSSICEGRGLIQPAERTLGFEKLIQETIIPITK